MKTMHTYPLQVKLMYELKVLVRDRVIVLMLLLLLIHIETVDKMYSMVEELKLLARCLQESDKCKKNVNRARTWIICLGLFFFLLFQSDFPSIFAFSLQMISSITMS